MLSVREAGAAVAADEDEAAVADCWCKKDRISGDCISTCLCYRQREREREKREIVLLGDDGSGLHEARVARQTVSTLTSFLCCSTRSRRSAEASAGCCEAVAVPRVLSHELRTRDEGLRVRVAVAVSAVEGGDWLGDPRRRSLVRRLRIPAEDRLLLCFLPRDALDPLT